MTHRHWPDINHSVRGSWTFTWWHSAVIRVSNIKTKHCSSADILQQALDTWQQKAATGNELCGDIWNKWKYKKESPHQQPFNIKKAVFQTARRKTCSLIQYHQPLYWRCHGWREWGNGDMQGAKCRLDEKWKGLGNRECAWRGATERQTVTEEGMKTNWDVWDAKALAALLLLSASLSV